MLGILKHYGNGLSHMSKMRRCVSEFAPGSDGRMTTMGVYVRDLLLGQYYFDSLFPRIPVPIMRQIVANLEKMNLPTKQSGVTGESSRLGSDDTARRPPSVKAALSVSFGQRAPHRASTRDSSPVRRTLPPPRERRSHSRERPDNDRDRVRDRDHDRDRDRERRHKRSYDDRDGRDRDSHRYSDRGNERRDYGRSGRDRDWYRGDSSSRRSRSRSRSPSRASSDRRPSPFGDGNRDKVSSNLAKLKDLYGDVSDKKKDAGNDRLMKDTSTEEVIRLGGSSWK
ncbi:pre-mRNA splicing factor SR-like 1 isoform X2 [Asparagus officinalis]|uniref:pre-mRNA splicing factor SR-like 1 isoform X2 n=1 Tax=Asparagus officinalis TaxID=4686 RepID=UPI00098E708B|nr:pre-mRNA splicing factor SR-like 1 isoform X2 [Asparagus officinalis]XP_020265662.1 pre-mRNA splicing factor SR-like 1 isoform X2 [Asparagus officinalis]XP_020265663.1 pre-mRNA splicing factor SR-like 1 isoform X2 [Asparagus officinalis]